MLEGLLKTHSHSLNNESLATLMTKVESIINSRPLTVETINDTKSDMPLSPSNLTVVNSAYQIYTQKEDGVMCNILQTKSGTDGEKNFSRSSNLNRSGRTKFKTSKFEVLY